MVHKILWSVALLMSIAFAKTHEPQSSAHFIIPATAEYARAAWTATVIDTAGDTISGKKSSITVAGSQVTKLRIKDKQKVKHTFTPETMKSFSVPLNKVQRGVLFVESVVLKGSVSQEKLEVFKRERAEWIQVPKPGKPGKFLMLQELNPHFDQIITVYQSPEYITVTHEYDNGFSLKKGAFEELDDEYMLLIEGKSIEISEKDYGDEDFEAIFGDCPKMMQKYPTEDDRHWSLLPDHILEYTEYKLAQ